MTELKLSYSQRGTFNEEQIALMEAGYCGRRRRNHTEKDHPYCMQVAGAQTEHKGTGACWLHGGMAPIKTGRYSTVLNERVRTLIEEFEEDPDPYDTRSEIAGVRALFVDFINRYDAYAAALLAWHESWAPGMPHAKMLQSLSNLLAGVGTVPEARDDPDYKNLVAWRDANLKANPKPMQLLDLADAYRMLSEVTKMVERVVKQNMAQAISRKEFTRILQEIGNIIDTTVEDDSTKRRIRDKIGSLRLA